MWLAEKAWDIVAGIFKGLWESIIGPFDDLHGLKTLVFNRYPEGEKVYGTFTASQLTDTIAPGVQAMSYIVGFFLVLAIIFMGSKISNAGLNPSNRTVFIEFVRDWIIVVLLVTNVGFVYEMVFMFNSAIISLIDGQLIDGLQDKLMPDLEDSGLVGWIIIGLFMLGVTVWANFYYIMREITLIVLMILGPVFIALFVMPSTKGVTLAWFKEFFGTVMVQSVNAVTLFAIATVARPNTSQVTMNGEAYDVFMASVPVAGGNDFGIIQMTLMYLVVIPTGEAIRGLLNLGGDTTGRLGKFGAMAGMAGMAGVYGAMKSATSGKGFAESLKNGYDRVRGNTDGANGANGSDTSGAVVGAAAGTDSRASRMLRAGEIMSKGGKMVLGSAGTVAGAVMGPQGAIIGGGLGTEVGGRVGGVSGRLGSAAKDKLANMRNGNLSNAMRDGKSAMALDKEHDQIADNLADLQTKQWADSNKAAFMQQHSNDPDRENKWNKAVASQRKQFKEQNKADLKSGKFDGNFAKASDLSEQYAQERLDESVKKDGRDAFIARELKKNPNMSQDDIEKAWVAEKDDRLQKFRKQGNEIARKVTGNKPTDSFVDKNAFVNAAKDNDMARFDQTEKQFKNQFKKQNPNATDQDANKAWDEARLNQQGIVARRGQAVATKTNSAIPSLGSNDRKANDLVASTADQMTKNWAQANEKPFKEKIRQQGSQKVEQEVETEWQKQVAQVHKDNVQKAEGKTADWAKANEANIKAGLAKDSPNLTQQQLDNTFQSMKDGKLQENLKVADKQTADWANQNQQAVKQGIREQKAPTIEQSVNDQWKGAIQQQANQNYAFANAVAQEVSGGQSLSGFIDKGKFEQAMVGNRVEQAKTAIQAANPNMSAQELDQAVAKQAAFIQQETSNAVNSVAQVPISKGYGTKTALAAQYASQATDQWANNPSNKQAFEQKFQKDFDATPENQALKQANPTAYNAKLNGAMGQKWDRTVQDQYGQNLKSAEDAMIVDTSSNGVMLSNTAGVVVGMKAFAGSLKNNSETMIKAQAFNNATGSIGERYGEAVRAVYDHRYGEDAPVEVKEKAYRDDVAYSSGVLRGASGYQKKAMQVMNNPKKNPFTEQMYDSMLEVSDVARMAQTETIDLPNGQQQTRVAQGAVQLVVEKDRSYLQVKTKDGTVETVSPYGAGDSSLDDGKVLFKDYNIEDGQFVPASKGTGDGNGFYAKDTAGYKMGHNSPVNIDANQLMNRSRRTIPNQEAEPYHDAYNHHVDQGNFDLNAIKSNSADNKAVLVVEQNRSYLAMRGDDDKMYRVSPVQQVGNSNLQQGQVIYKEYVVEGNQLRERSLQNPNMKLDTYVHDTKGQQQTVDSSRIPDSINVNDIVPQNINVQELVPIPVNRRYQRRQQTERQRNKSGAYL